jgi:hypothetical protein
MTDAKRKADMNEPTTSLIAVDRLHASVKSLWRLLTSGLILGLAYLIGFQIGSWSLFWESQPVTFLAIGTMLIALSIVGAAFAFSGLRWLMLACWPRPLNVQIDATAIRASFGPFGSDTTAWTDVRCAVAEGFDVELLSHIGNDAFTPQIRDVHSERELFSWIQSRTGADPESLTRALRPHFEARLTDR